MSRDARDPERLDDVELLGAFVDGAGELPADDRDRVEAALARDPALAADEAALRGLIGQLRALPPEGNEPDWSAMERSIRSAVTDQPIRPWWRRWQWLAPLATCAAAAALALALWPRPEAVIEAPPVAAPAPAPARAPDEVVALWLDGAEVDVDASAAGLLELTGFGGDPAQLDDAELDEVGLLPAASLAWVDHLDDDAMARVEKWLADRKKG